MREKEQKPESNNVIEALRQREMELESLLQEVYLEAQRIRANALKEKEEIEKGVNEEIADLGKKAEEELKEKIAELESEYRALISQELEKVSSQAKEKFEGAVQEVLKGVLPQK